MGTVHAKSAVQQYEKTDKSDKINLDGIEARVDYVHVDGLNRTKDDVVIKTVRSLFKAQDFQQVVLAAHEVRTALESIGCFQNIGILIDTSHGPEATPHGLAVTFYVSELKRIVGGVNTLVGNNEGSLVFGLRLPNLFGRGERFQTEYSYGTKNATGFNATVSKPLLAFKRASITGILYQQSNDYPWSGYKSNERGVLLDLMFESAPKITHNLRWEGAWRELGSLPYAPFGIREEAGHSLKSALKHIVSIDKRDSPILPNIGYYFKLQQELAGLGGNTYFLKHEFEVQANYPLPFDTVIQASFAAGLANLPNAYKSFNICDRFFLGGPLNVRGFANRGIGPIVDECALGASAYWASGLHLYSFLPFRPGREGFGDLFRLHFFLNAGNINDFKFSSHDYHENLTMLKEGSRLSYGLGLVLRIGQVGRFELNYCIPLFAQKTDKLAAGLQFGVGVSYL